MSYKQFVKVGQPYLLWQRTRLPGNKDKMESLEHDLPAALVRFEEKLGHPADTLRLQPEVLKDCPPVLQKKFQLTIEARNGVLKGTFELCRKEK